MTPSDRARTQNEEDEAREAVETPPARPSEKGVGA